MEYERTDGLTQLPQIVKMLTWICVFLSSVGNEDSPKALRDLITHPWWKRCWVTQECVVSTNIQLNFRGQVMEWDSLTRLLYLIQRINMSSIKPASTSWHAKADGLKQDSHQINHIEILRYAFHGEANRLQQAHKKPKDTKDPLNLMTVLLTTQGRKASDPRDKIYALLGLVDPAMLPSYGIEVDYSRSCTTEHLFIKATTAALRVHKTLEPLMYAGID